MSEIKDGDLVRHVDNPGLDYRIVTRVEGPSLWLYLAGKEMGPFPVSNYAVVKTAAELTKETHG